MPHRLSRVFTSALFVSALALSQQPRTDADLFRDAASETDPAKKLLLLDQWTAAFPDSAYPQQRNLHYISAWSTLAGNATRGQASAEVISAGENAAHAMLDKGDALFAPSMMPAGVSPSDWAAARLEFLHQGHVVLATIAMNAKNYPAAEAELTALLEMNHNDATVSSQLGAAIVAEQQPDRYPAAIFHLAHAVMSTGPAAFDDATKKSTEAYLESLYRNYHGDLSGLDQVKLASAEPWIPPAGWTIQSIAAITQAQRDRDAQFAADHPEVALWRNLKARLQAPDGRDYFTAEVKGARIPNLKGKVAAQPDSRTLLVMIDAAPEATLKFDAALTGKVPPGTLLDFAGVLQSFESEPFMLTFAVSKKEVTGLP